MQRLPMSVLVVGLLVVLPQGAEIHAQALPTDFKLSATVGSVAPWEGRATVTLDHAGRISYIQFTTGENPFVMAESTFTVSADDILPLWQMIQDSSFFTLKPRMVDSTIKDGVFARFLITANRVSHQVIVKNTAQPRLQAIIESLNELLPESMQLMYARPEIFMPKPRNLHNSGSAIIDRGLQKDAVRKQWRDVKSRAAPKHQSSPAYDGTTPSHPGTVVAYQVPLDQAVAGGYASLSSKGEISGDAVSVYLDNSKPHATDRISVIFYIEYYGDGATPENVDKINTDIMKTWNGHKTSDGKAVDVTVVPRIDAAEPAPSGDPNYHQIQLTIDPNDRSYVNVPIGTGANDGTMTGVWGVQDKGPGTWGHEVGHLGNLDDKYDDYNKQADGSWVNERTGQSVANNDQLLNLVATKYSQETADKAKSFVDNSKNCSVVQDVQL